MKAINAKYEQIKARVPRVIGDTTLYDCRDILRDFRSYEQWNILFYAGWEHSTLHEAYLYSKMKSTPITISHKKETNVKDRNKFARTMWTAAEHDREESLKQILFIDKEDRTIKIQWLIVNFIRDIEGVEILWYNKEYDLEITIE